MENEERKKLSDRLRRATRPVMLQVGPSVYIKNPDAKSPQDYTIAQFVPDGEGQFRLVAHPERMVRLTQEVLDMIGMSNQRMTMVRLAKAGLIEMIAVAPRTYSLNLDSWYNHVRYCAEHPDCWEEGQKYLKEYRRAI